MVKNVDIIKVEDPSVSALLAKTADQLHKKYNKQRKINERFLKKKTPAKMALSILFDVLCGLILVFGITICFATINTTANGYLPNFAGYNNLVISSESMVKSGYNVGDIVVIHSVNTKTLNVNDKIAFYVYSPSYNDFDVSKTTNISSVVSKTKYTFSLKQLLGFQSKQVKNAARSNSKLVFHHIKEIYLDENGERWFKTYGSSNSADDTWTINEKYVIGIEDQGFVPKVFVKIVGFSAKPYGILVIVIPAGILLLTLVFSFMKNLQIAKLELDCVEEKRKITDPICIKNRVGFQMSNKTKYKILAQASDEEKEIFADLLWKRGTMPKSIKKYYLKRKLLLSVNKELLNLNRECEKMFKEGQNPKLIASHYIKEKQKIENKSAQIQERFKAIQKIKRAKYVTKNH